MQKPLRPVGEPSGGRQVYNNIGKNPYFPALVVYCYATVRNCSNCARNRLKRRKNVTRLQLFPAGELKSSFCNDILGPFIRAPRRNEYLLVLTDRFYKMTKLIPIRGISAAKSAKHFANTWLFNYCSPSERFSDSGGFFTSKFLLDVFHIMSIQKNVATTYRLQSKDQV